MCITIEDIYRAHETIKTYIKKTPLIDAPEALLKQLHHKGKIYFKCENLQWTNTFKVRGAFNAILNLSEAEKKRGVVTRSSGNFAQAVAYAANKLQIRAKIILPDNIPKIKLQLTQQFGPEIVFSGSLHEEGDEIVRQIVEKEGMTQLHPYNQKNVIAGQGTAALEIFEDLPTIANFFCPIGGGGLLAGCATAFKALKEEIYIVGIEPSGAADYYQSREAGKPIPCENVDTIVTAAATTSCQRGCAPSSGWEKFCHWPLCKKNVDKVDKVSDKEIKIAMKYFKEHTDLVTEPSGATAFASLLLHKQKLLEGDTVVLISGSNVDPEMFRQCLSEV